jgi:KDO2-lipid IV(A) lauroyltransferase
VIRNFINYGGVVARRMILGALHLLGGAAGHFLYVKRGRRYRNAYININLCFPSLSAREVNRLTRLSLHETGKLLFEVLFFWLFPGRFYQRLIHGVTGEEYLLQAQAEGRAVILVSPHLGNWEVFNTWAGSHGAYVSYKPLSCTWMDRRIRHCRQCNGSKLFSIGNEGLKVLYRVLDKGGVVAVFPDQVPESGGRVIAPFFKIPAWTGTLVPRLASKKNARIICGYARRLPGTQGFEIYLHPAPEEIYKEDSLEAVTALNLGMEECIRRSPEQYTWQYKRFKGGINNGLYSRTRASN